LSDRRDYSRPNQKWECGWKESGFSCNSGPSKNGKCSGKSECQPVKGDEGYRCTRSALNGGPCSIGPLPTGECSSKFPPCSPRRSLRVKRQLVSVVFVALVLSLLFIGLGGSQVSEDILSPGPLSSRHSSISQNCSACHAQAHGQPWQWFFSKPEKSITDSCQSCHTMGDDALKPHSLSLAALAGIQQKSPNKSAEKKAAMNAALVSSKTQCISCHKEHRGESFEMTKLSNSQCQSCHTQAFTSFSNGHPEFTNYPFNQRVNILFDHTSHFSKHFAKKKATNLSCNSCHSPDTSSGKMAIKAFDVSCAGCHSDQIYGKSAINKGIIFFVLPTLDVETLRENDIQIGSWPADTDGEISPMMRLMLSKDKHIASLLDAFESDDLELDDLSDADGEVLAQVAELVWGIKALLANLIGHGLGEFRDVVRALDGRELASRDLAELSGSLPVEVLRAASRDWFGREFMHEMALHQQPGSGNETVEIADAAAAAVQGEGAEIALEEIEIEETETEEIEIEEIEDETWMQVGGWYRSNGDFTIRYRPRGHADAFIKSWVNISAKNAKQSPLANDVLADMADRKDSPGLCMKCHSIEQLTDDDKSFYQVHWQGKAKQADQQSFNRFEHSSHLNLIKDKGCMTCHAMNDEADFKLAYGGFDATKFESNFQPIKKATCIQCHQSGRVNESCTTCHKYHIGDFFTSETRMKDIHTQVLKGVK